MFKSILLSAPHLPGQDIYLWFRDIHIIIKALQYIVHIIRLNLVLPSKYVCYVHALLQNSRTWAALIHQHTYWYVGEWLSIHQYTYRYRCWFRQVSLFRHEILSVIYVPRIYFAQRVSDHVHIYRINQYSPLLTLILMTDMNNSECKRYFHHVVKNIACAKLHL